MSKSNRREKVRAYEEEGDNRRERQRARGGSAKALKRMKQAVKIRDVDALMDMEDDGQWL